ncbi:glycosyltransferase family 4 protein [Caulobacter endophyticus]|uniref:glycosyltransferase family 4 protein n=1 Tax=Caulobacter endophyticus TaxID=2172652 RepID=UPI00240F7136|nr:glycosyltransferase family 4 protein [Caulobacter endophyticus]MDG2531891.1 glycosyltransferase family 4 protein [Caulobacter endophyticus]
MRVMGVASFAHNGGAQVALQRLARKLSQRGHQVEVVFLYGKREAADQDINARVLVETQTPSALDYGRCLIRLISVVRAYKPDAILGFLPLAAVFSAVAGAICGVRARIASQRTPGPTFSALMQFCDRLAGSTGLYTKIVCVSQSVADSFWNYPQTYRRRLRVVNNGIEWSPLQMDRALARQTFGIEDGEPLFIAVGRLEPQKNYEFLIQRFCSVGKGRLLIAGAGREEANLRTLLSQCDPEGRVSLLGHLERDKIRALLGAADVFLQASFYEGQSNALLEAMHASLPCLVSNISMQRETLTDEYNQPCGLMAGLHEATAWEQHIADLADDPSLRSRLGAAGQALVNRQFSLTRMVDSFEKELLEPVRGSVLDMA